MAKAVAVSEVLEDSNLVKHVKFISFDTTASNTERNTGACVMLQQKLQLLSLPRRRHIYEFIVDTSEKHNTHTSS